MCYYQFEEMLLRATALSLAAALQQNWEFGFNLGTIIDHGDSRQELNDTIILCEVVQHYSGAELIQQHYMGSLSGSVSGLTYQRLK